MLQPQTISSSFTFANSSFFRKWWSQGQLPSPQSNWRETVQTLAGKRSNKEFLKNEWGGAWVVWKSSQAEDAIDIECGKSSNFGWWRCIQNHYWMGIDKMLVRMNCMLHRMKMLHRKRRKVIICVKGAKTLRVVKHLLVIEQTACNWDLT